MTAKRSEKPFEELYGGLEQVVEKLEKGGLSLEESINLYEEGMDLAKRCLGILDGAEQRITKLRESFAQQPDAEEAPAGEEALKAEGE